MIVYEIKVYNLKNKLLVKGTITITGYGPDIQEVIEHMLNDENWFIIVNKVFINKSNIGKISVEHKPRKN